MLLDETQPKSAIETNQGSRSAMDKQSPYEEPGTLVQPLVEAELTEFAEYITYENQERIAVMLGFGLDKVETLRCKHRENVTGVSLDLLVDWMRCNPQQTNRQVSDRGLG